MVANFINRGGRTYLVANPNSLGQGKDPGYYREGFGDFTAVLLVPFYRDKKFSTEVEAQEWLKSEARVS